MVDTKQDALKIEFENAPLVSVIMPTYNCAKYIIQSVHSVVAQTFTNWELIIVDDCSTDGTEEILKPILKSHLNIHYYQLPNNSGPAIARTEAINRANGKYIAFLDSDDIWLPKKLEKQIAFMENTGAFFSCTAYEIMNERGKRLQIECIPPEKTDYKSCIYLSNPIGNLTVVYNQEVLGNFSVPPIRKRNDFALWLQILKKEKYCYGMKETLAVYRKGRKESVSNKRLQSARYHWQLYREIEKMNIWNSVVAMICWAFVKGTGFGLNKHRIKQSR